jgi:serine/threonine-protein kinase
VSLSVKLLANWPLVGSLLDEALDLPTRERAVWLDNLPSDHQDLKTQLAGLLSVAPSSCSFPLRLNESLLALDCEGSPEAVPFELIGPWRLLHKIGEGGMAEVWKAERLETDS